MKLVKLIANLGYGSRREVIQLFRDGYITDTHGEVLYTDDPFPADGLLVGGEPLDPPPGLIIALHKPVGYTCSTRDPSRLIYDLLPTRFRYRKPVLSPIGRLDRDTSGLLLMTDDGQFLHRIISPKAQIKKCYEAHLAEDLRGHETDLFASGTLMLESETTPLAPATLDILSPRCIRLTLTEGRYHQVRRMFAATGNAVTQLQRIAIGQLHLDALALPEGTWRRLEEKEITSLLR